MGRDIVPLLKKTSISIIRDLLQTPAVPDILTAESTDNQTAESLQAEMALRSRSPGGGGGGYVSVVSNDEMQSFQQNGYHDDEDIDFAPQNGYHYPEDDTEVPRKGKKSGAPKVDLMGKIAAIKNMKIPSPEEIKEGYLNSAFHKSLHQPLMVKAKVEKIDVQKARQAVTQEKTPLQLGNIESFSDIPVPKFIEQKFASKPESVKIEKPTPTETDIEVSNLPLSERIYGTLPASLKDTKLLAKAECEDPEIQAARAEVVKSKSVHELSQVTSLADVPIPDVIENFLKKKEKPPPPAKKKKKKKKKKKS